MGPKSLRLFKELSPTAVFLSGPVHQAGAGIELEGLRLEARSAEVVWKFTGDRWNSKSSFPGPSCLSFGQANPAVYCSVDYTVRCV